MQRGVIRLVAFGVEGALHSDIPELLITGSSYRARREQSVVRVARPCPLLFFPPFKQHLITELLPNRTAPADKLPSASFQSLISRCPYYCGERSE
jgi:hypothetical protein